MDEGNREGGLQGFFARKGSLVVEKEAHSTTVVSFVYNAHEHVIFSKCRGLPSIILHRESSFGSMFRCFQQCSSSIHGAGSGSNGFSNGEKVEKRTLG